MIKVQWLVSATLVAAFFVLGACGPMPTAEPQPTATVQPTAVATSVPPTTNPDPSIPVTVSPPAEPGYCELAPLPQLPVRPADSTDWVKGASEQDAAITLYEYADFRCPGCGGMYPIVDLYLEDNPGVRLVYRHFPLDFHQNAFMTSEASEAAGAQGKFWQMHDLLFDRAQEWSVLSAEELSPKLSEYAKELGLDVERFDREMGAGTYKAKVQAAYDEAQSLGLPGTPSFIFNNVLFPSDIGLSYNGLVAFRSILDNQDTLFFDAIPEMTVKVDDAYQATLKTTKGDIVVKLLPEATPTNVNNFIFLAQQNWYNGSDFFFVRDNFVAVTGDPTNSTVGYPGYYCAGEEQQPGFFDRAGLVGMLPNGQFFITLGTDAAQLSSPFAIVGQVLKGFEVLDSLNRLDVGDPSVTPDVLQSIQIVGQ